MNIHGLLIIEHCCEKYVMNFKWMLLIKKTKCQISVYDHMNKHLIGTTAAQKKTVAQEYKNGNMLSSQKCCLVVIKIYRSGLS